MEEVRKNLENKIIFLDRDGTIIVDPEDERVDREDKIKLFPDSIEALKYLADHGFAIILITNQAGISEGKINIQDFDRINNKVLEMLAPSGIKIIKTFMCPHGPKDGCECRKPKPTMLLEAAKEFDIDLAKVYMVGDRESDTMSGINAGTKTILVKTANVPVEAKQATYTAPNLLDAVKYISDNYIND
ncbi:HAD family hydrolase [Candidatus Nomurabacteria bacterium]|nr:HAD family hydrolase [Candidatus Nomurabacteria bacterium]